MLIVGWAKGFLAHHLGKPLTAFFEATVVHRGGQRIAFCPPYKKPCGNLYKLFKPFVLCKALKKYRRKKP
jgi:hypothetical protein